MKRILLLAGVIGCCVLFLGGYLIIRDFGGFANFLGEESKKIIEIETTKFIGSWDIENEEERLIFHSTGDISGYLNGNYEVVEDKLFINLSLTEITYEYNYCFSNNFETLTLSEINTGAGLILHKI